MLTSVTEGCLFFGDGHKFFSPCRDINNKLTEIRTAHSYEEHMGWPEWYINEENI